MTKEELLQNIKDDVAHQFNLKSWDDLYWNDNQPSNIVIDEVANRYAIAMCEEQKKECSKSAMIHIVSECGCRGIICSPNVCATLDYKSIEKCINVAE